jgi:serine/threonine-protein kinase
MSATGSSTRLTSGDVFAGKFRLERQFASGGMGFVWRAWNTQLEIPVAVKVMAAGMADLPDFVARFELEARAAAQIRSPHVVSIYEHGVHEGLPYMVMELLEGEDLSKRLKREKRLTMIATSQIVRDMCKALQRAHDLRIVHRDIKPANVFLARDGDEEIVKVLDFGIAKVTHGGGGNMTATGEMMGTPSYMSPEHIRASKHVDHRADLWSVSVIAFRALTGQLPFTGPILDVVDHILTGSAPIPSGIAPDLSPAVDAFFARALARDIDHRFQSARELAAALAKLVGSESLIEASLPELALEGPESTTIPLGPGAARRALAAIEPADGSTVSLVGPRDQAGAGAAPATTTTDLKNLRRTVPMGPAPQYEAKLALAEARALAEAQALADEQSLAQAAAGAVAAPSPWTRRASNRPLAAAPPPRRAWTWWAVAASALVVIAAGVWVSMHLGKIRETTPVTLPAASTP